LNWSNNSVAGKKPGCLVTTQPSSGGPDSEEDLCDCYDSFRFVSRFHEVTGTYQFRGAGEKTMTRRNVSIVGRCAINFAVSLCGLLAALALAEVTLAQIPTIPGIKRPGVTLPRPDQFLKEKPTLTTELSDAYPDIPYLDDFNPDVLAPLAEVPYDSQGDFLRVPGLFEFRAQSYCLHAGTYAPHKGDGYLFAPLKGPRAAVIEKILRQSVYHPDIPQQDIQVLLWGILAKAKIATMPAPLQKAARAMLSDREIADLNGGALGVIPESVRQQLLGRLPEAARRTFEAEANIRQQLSQPNMPGYAQLEQVALLQGDPPGGGSEVPPGRWSYNPGARMFLRVIPQNLAVTPLQRYHPERFHVERDVKGRITLLRNAAGERIEATYDDSVSPLQIPGEGTLRGWAFKSVRFISPGSAEAPGVGRVASWTDTGWVWFGHATGRERLETANPRFGDAPLRYRAVRDYVAQMKTLVTSLKRNECLGGVVRGEDDLFDLAQFRAAMKQLAVSSGANAWAAAHAEVTGRAWMSLLDTYASKPPSTAMEYPLADPKAHVYLASLTPKALPLAQEANTGITLPDYGPTESTSGGGSAGGAAVPGNLRQRLGQSGRPAPKSTDSFDRAVELYHWFDHAIDGLKLALDPWGFAADKLNPMTYIFNRIIEFDFAMMRKILKALSLDPPRSDYTAYAEPQKFTGIPQIVATAGVSEKRARAANGVMSASLDLLAQLQAAKMSVDRMGGAMQAGDQVWAARQGAAVVHYKKSAGVAMITLADRLDALVRLNRDEGVADVTYSAEQARAFQARLGASGFSEQDKTAARTLGLTDAALEEIKAEWLANPSRMDGVSFQTILTNTANALRTQGVYLNRLPAVELPGATPTVASGTLAQPQELEPVLKDGALPFKF
jgi:hypothetical protein